MKRCKLKTVIICAVTLVVLVFGILALNSSFAARIATDAKMKFHAAGHIELLLRDPSTLDIHDMDILDFAEDTENYYYHSQSI